jgi:hypothetical protein
MNVAQHKPAQKSGTVHYEVLNEMVVYSPDTMQAASLNESASAIWELCDGTRTIDEICRDLASQIGMTPDRLSDDVKNVVNRLYELELLSREPILS